MRQQQQPQHIQQHQPLVSKLSKRISKKQSSFRNKTQINFDAYMGKKNVVEAFFESDKGMNDLNAQFNRIDLTKQ